MEGLKGVIMEDTTAEVVSAGVASAQVEVALEEVTLEEVEWEAVIIMAGVEGLEVVGVVAGEI